MITFENPSDLAAHVGEELGVSEWLTVEQSMIDEFARLADDHQWIHVDVERAAREMPDGKTIAHGYLLLTLLPRMRVYTVKKMARAMNYGLDKLRFTAPVQVGSRIRLRQTLTSASRIEETAYRTIVQGTIEIESRERPAIVYDQVLQYWDPT